MPTTGNRPRLGSVPGRCKVDEGDRAMNRAWIPAGALAGVSVAGLLALGPSRTRSARPWSSRPSPGAAGATQVVRAGQRHAENVGRTEPLPSTSRRRRRHVDGPTSGDTGSSPTSATASPRYRPPSRRGVDVARRARSSRRSRRSASSRSAPPASRTAIRALRAARGAGSTGEQPRTPGSGPRTPGALGRSPSAAGTIGLTGL